MCWADRRLMSTSRQYLIAVLLIGTRVMVRFLALAMVHRQPMMHLSPVMSLGAWRRALD